MPYELPDLPYDYAALEPHIDEQTMRIHHDKHHKAYVDNANAALQGTEWENRPVEQVLLEIDLLPEDKQAAVRNNAGGHANHSLFWEIMSPAAADSSSAPTVSSSGVSGSKSCARYRSTRSRPSRSRLVPSWRRIRSRPRPRSPPSVIGLNVFVVIRGRWPVA